MFVKSTLVAYAERMLVVAPGMGADELFVACLISCAVVVIAGESEAVLLAADEGGGGRAFCETIEAIRVNPIG